MPEKTEAPRTRAIQQWAVGAKSNLQPPATISDAVALVPSRFTITVALKKNAVLLFNSMTRSLSRLNAAEAKKWRQWEETGVVDRQQDQTLARSLMAEGFLTTKGKDELKQVEKDYFVARHDKSQMMLTVAPTMACNLACGYCFQGLEKDLGKLDKRLPDAIIDFVDTRKQSLNGLNITWYGGEPLMAKKEIFSLADRLISLCDRNGIQYSSTIVTNGYFLTVDIAQQLWSRRCTNAQVTIDGVEETHDKMRPLTSGRGSFKTIIENIGAVLDETPLGISMRVNVGRQNVDECDRLLDEFNKRGFGQRGNFSLYFAPIDAATPESGTAYVEGMARKDFNEAVVTLGSKARNLGLASPVAAPKGILGMCVAAKDNGYVITHNGDIHKCWETAHDPRKRIGSIFKPENLDDNLNAALWKGWSPFESDVCKACRILPMCGGFCGHRYLYHGAGNDMALPCPDWKWNTAEYLFARALAMEAVQEDEWLPEEATVDAMQSGGRHSSESLQQCQESVLKKVSASRGEAVNREYLHHGDGRFFETAPADLSKKGG